MKSIRAIAVLVVAAAALGCTDLPLDSGGGSGGDFDITVGSGTTPSYSWQGGPAFEVSVVRSSNETVPVWRVASPGTGSGMASPVRHGTVPGGAIELVGSERTLTRGVSYRVEIKLPNGDAAFQRFTP